jgi:hypothetical protein
VGEFLASQSCCCVVASQLVRLGSRLIEPGTSRNVNMMIVHCLASFVGMEDSDIVTQVLVCPVYRPKRPHRGSVAIESTDGHRARVCTPI